MLSELFKETTLIDLIELVKVTPLGVVQRTNKESLAQKHYAYISGNSKPKNYLGAVKENTYWLWLSMLNKEDQLSHLKYFETKCIYDEALKMYKPIDCELFYKDSRSVANGLGIRAWLDAPISVRRYYLSLPKLLKFYLKDYSAGLTSKSFDVHFANLILCHSYKSNLEFVVNTLRQYKTAYADMALIRALIIMGDL